MINYRNCSYKLPERKGEVQRLRSTGGKRTMKDDGNENSIVFKPGTIKQTDLSVQFSDGTQKDITGFEVKGDNNGTALFEFLANPKETTNVEWSYAKVGEKTGDEGNNVIGSSHDKSTTHAGSSILAHGYYIREMNHNHPSGVDKPSSGDLRNRNLYQSKFPNIKLHTYTPQNGYRSYTTVDDIIQFKVRDYVR